jgi:hypothetical protein
VSEELRSVSKCFSSITAVDHVSFSARGFPVVERVGALGLCGFGPMLDREWWEARWPGPEWRRCLAEPTPRAEDLRAIREATYTGRPLGSREFVAGLEQQLGRRLATRAGGRPKHIGAAAKDQLSLWRSQSAV